MVDLFDADVREQNRQSSKGNQMKWLKDGVWYKADYTGYEGLAEYVVSELLRTSNLDEASFQLYKVEKMRYRYAEYLGCSSINFLPEGWQMITLERLFHNTFGQSLGQSIYRISDLEERVKFLVDQTIRITGLKDFGVYMSKLLTVDAIFLNEDRHTHNIAVLLDSEGVYRYCPIFDNGACLLSDTQMDYPLNIPTAQLMKEVQPNTFCRNFDEQLDVVEKLYGRHVKFSFTPEETDVLLAEAEIYSEVIRKRVLEIIRIQHRKYQYLFV